MAPHKFVDPCPVTGDISDPSVRVSWLKCVVQLGNDECEGKVPLAPNSDLGLPCAGRSITNGALGKLLVSDGKDTEGCMALLRTTSPGPSFNGQSWPAVYYLFNHNFNATDRAFLMESIKATAATYHGNVTGTAAQAAVGSVGTDVSYNNIYYMGMVNGILFGEIAGDEEATASGYQLLDNWLQYVQVIGDTPCVQEGNTRSLHMLCTLPHHNTHHTQPRPLRTRRQRTSTSLLRPPTTGCRSTRCTWATPSRAGRAPVPSSSESSTTRGRTSAPITSCRRRCAGYGYGYGYGFSHV
jgi:hypothetical protein